MTPSICLSTRLRRAARQTSRAYDHALAPLDLSVAQYALLRAIVRLEKPTLTQLSEETDLDPSTLGRNVRVLTQKQLLGFTAGHTDKRTRILSLTPQGTAVLQDATALWAEVQRRFEAQLGDGGRDALFTLLQTFEPQTHEPTQ